MSRSQGRSRCAKGNPLRCDCCHGRPRWTNYAILDDKAFYLHYFKGIEAKDAGVRRLRCTVNSCQQWISTRNIRWVFFVSPCSFNSNGIPVTSNATRSELTGCLVSPLHL